MALPNGSMTFHKAQKSLDFQERLLHHTVLFLGLTAAAQLASPTKRTSSVCQQNPQFSGNLKD
jgi:hypothetical protein